MRITPTDVRNASFRVVLRGYAVAEVDAFLDAVEAELTRLTGEDEEGRPARDETAGPAVAPPPQTGPNAESSAERDDDAARALRVLRLAELTAEQTLADAAAEAQRATEAAEAAAGEVRRDAERSASEVLAAARAEADAVLAAARAEAAQLEAELRDRHQRETVALERRCQQLREDLEQLERTDQRHRDEMRALAQEQLRLLGPAGPLHAVAAS